MAVKKKNNTTADGDPQETKVGGNDVTVNHNSSEPLVTVAVQNTAGIAQQVTVVVNFNGNEEQNCSKTEGETPKRPQKRNPWNEFLKQNKGRNLTISQLSALYQDEKKKTQHASLITDGSSGA